MKQLYYSYTIDVPMALVWATITTVEGIKSYLSQDCRVVPEVGGAYEIYFDRTMPEGQRGSEGMRVLCMEKEKRFGHTWNNPPSLPSIRNQQTAVYYELSTDIRGWVQLDFYHTGFGESEAWDEAYAYFGRAWGEVVLPKLLAVLRSS